jgi:hypothetical protein
MCNATQQAQAVALDVQQKKQKNCDRKDLYCKKIYIPSRLS